MADHGPDTDEATALVRWLLESGVRGLGLTKTHALQRVIVRACWSFAARPHRNMPRSTTDDPARSVAP